MCSVLEGKWSPVLRWKLSPVKEWVHPVLRVLFPHLSWVVCSGREQFWAWLHWVRSALTSVLHLQVGETPGVWITAFTHCRTREPSLTKCCQDAAMKSLAGFEKRKEMCISSFSFKENINEQADSSVRVGENWTRSHNWQWLPVWPLGKFCGWQSVTKQCCLWQCRTGNCFLHQLL